MKKQLQKDNEGLKIYFTKNECELYSLIEGKILEIDDKILINEKGDKKK